MVCNLDSRDLNGQSVFETLLSFDMTESMSYPGDNGGDVWTISFMRLFSLTLMQISMFGKRSYIFYKELLSATDRDKERQIKLLDPTTYSPSF